LHPPAPRSLLLLPERKISHVRSGKPRLRAYVVHVVVLSNHQSGRDTHIRQLKVFGPRRDMLQTADFGGLTTVDFSQYAVVR